MDENILQMLGIQSPGIVGPDDYSGGTGGFGAPAGMSAPAAVAPPPQDPMAAPPQNALQTLAAPPPQAMPAPTPLPVPTPPTRPARSRSSLLDHIGRVADVLAQVGGAAPLYQPTLDSRQDREITLGDHDRKVDLEKLNQALERAKVRSADGTVADERAARLKAIAGRVQAVVAKNPNADVGQVWSLFAQQGGIPADQAAALGQRVVADPSVLDGLAADGKEKYSGSIIYARNKDGKLGAFQPSLVGDDPRSALPEGWEALDPAMVVNTGGVTHVIGKNTGSEIHPYTNTAKPDTIITTGTQRSIAAGKNATARDIAAGRNATAVQIAGMPARAKAGASGAGGDGSNVLTLLDNIEGGFGDLHRLSALPGDNSGAVGNVLSALGRTHVGQAIGEQAGNASAQKRLEIMKNVSALQQAMLKSLPASATRTKFEQEMLARGLPDPSKMSYGTARTVIRQLRESFNRALAESRTAAPAARPTLRAPTRIQPNGGAGKPTVTNW